MPSFTEAIKKLDLLSVRSIPKSDLHNHCLLGGRLKQIEKFYGRRLDRFHFGERGVEGINEWIGQVYRPVLDQPGAFQAAVEAAFFQARSDGVSVLEMSIDVLLGQLFNILPENIIAILKESHQKIAPDIDYRPEIGIARSMSVRTLLSAIEPYLDSNYFQSIDLYDVETAQPSEIIRGSIGMQKIWG